MASDAVSRAAGRGASASAETEAAAPSRGAFSQAATAPPADLAGQVTPSLDGSAPFTTATSAGPGRSGASGARSAAGGRVLAQEVAVALSYQGSTQAVMMATPADLEDFAVGFTLSEGVAEPEDIVSIEPVETERGVDLRIWLRPEAGARLQARRRSMAGPVGCGLCGLDSLEEAVRAPRPIASGAFRMTADEVTAAAAALRAHQPLHDATRAVHAAAFWTKGAGVVAAREDVGRHNALDKLAGALRRNGIAADAGALVLSSRVSIDLVQKCCAMGAPVLIAVSAPTAAAVATAQAAGLTLVARARGDGFEVFAHPWRIGEGRRMAADKLIHMANQIARFMESKSEAEGAAGLAAHINDFWEPRMRRQLFEVLDAGGAGLRPLVLRAAPMIRRPQAEGV